MSLRNALPGRYKVATDPLQSERNIELFVVILALVLCLQLLYSGVRLMRQSLPGPVSPVQDALVVKNLQPLGKLSMEQSTELLARPLFWASRRPREAQEVVKAKKKLVPDKVELLTGVKLLGVFHGSEAAGVIVSVKGGRRRVLLGEEINGWTVESVQPRHAVLNAKGRQQTLQLKTTSGPVMSKPAAPKVQANAPQNAPAQSASGGTEDELSLGGSPGK